MRLAWPVVLPLALLGPACLQGAEHVDAAGGETLNNESTQDYVHNRPVAEAFIRAFADADFDLVVDELPVGEDWLGWPVPDGSSTRVMNRFGTIQSLDRQVYLHQGLDVLDVGEGTKLVAPISGVAVVLDSQARPGYDGHDYMTRIVTWDPESHLLVSMTHVNLRDDLKSSGGRFFPVTRGETLGEIVLIFDVRHTHLAVLDGGRRRWVDPSPLTGYRDHVPPDPIGVYVAPGAGGKSSTLVSGSIDLVYEVQDHDDDSAMDFEISKIAYQVTNAEGRVLAELARCDLDALIAPLDVAPVRSLFDLDGRDYSDWYGEDRSFAYALTALRSLDGGPCFVGEDDASFLEIGDDVPSIDVEVTAWDLRDNATTRTFTLRR